MFFVIVVRMSFFIFVALKKKLIFRDISIAVALQIVFRTFSYHKHPKRKTVTSTMAVCREVVH